jgi:quinol monooxygenase YgiN
MHRYRTPAYRCLLIELIRSCEMVSVIFEVWPEPAHRAGYLNWAAELHAELLKMDGFISIERFESLT